LTPLMAAALNGHVSTARLLITRGADPKAVAESDGWTALMCAAQAGNAELIDLLISRGADPAARDRKGHTALDIARGMKREEAAKRLEKL